MNKSSYTVRRGRSGGKIKSLRYGRILELAGACDVPVRWSYQTGVCHICETSLFSGAVVYAPEPSG